MTDSQPAAPLGHLPALPGLRRGAVDVLVVLGALVASAPYLFSDRHGVSDVRAADVAVLLLGTLPLAVVRRAPLAVFGWVALIVVGTAVFGDRPFTGASVLVAMYIVASSCEKRRVLSAVAVLELGVVVTVLRVGDGAWWWGTVFGTGLVAAATALGLYAATRRDYLEQLRDRAERLELERDQQMALTAAAERARLTREMHDVVAHHLTVMVALSEGAVAAAAASPERALDAMRAVSATGRRALNDTRSLLGVLRTGAPEGSDRPAEPVPALSGLDALVCRVREAGLPVTVEVQGAAGEVPTGVQLTVYRLVQEALTNTLKHAGTGASATVRLGFADGEVCVDVEDDGVGSTSPHEVGRGLTGMRERVQAFGGEVRAGPRPPHGWQVSARLQVAPEPAA